MIPETSAAPRTSRQKKRSDGEGSSSAAVNHSEDESGNENRRKSVRKRKRTHDSSENVTSKMAKATAGSSSRGGGARRRRRRRGGGGGGGGKQKQEAVTLFEVITMGRSAMQAVIDDWIEAYMADRDSSLLDLISFFIQCCGCRGVVTAEMCESRDDSELLRKMVEELDEDSGLQYKKFLAFPWILTVTWPIDTDGAEYPLVQSGPEGRWFYSELCDFVSVLVSQCQHAVIFDSYLMSALVSLLSELSDSYVRAFRHTCTLAAVKLQSALVGVALTLSVGIENNQKLLKVQRTRAARQRSSPQLERAQKKNAELQEKRSEVESMMDAIFKGVFLKRYRDVLPEIRSLCMEELGSWMKLYSSAFLTDSHLKYVGWMMYDKVPEVRLKCVLSLQSLYGDPELLPKLDLFTSRFKDRIISMTLDKDSEVALQTLKLLLLISRAAEDVLAPDDYKQLLQLVYSSQRPLAATAGELLYSRLLSSSASDRHHDESEDEEAHRQQTLARLKALLHFYHDSELHKHVVYLVDSLWDCGGPLLKDWPTLTALLLQEPSGFTQDEEAVLVEILVASVRQASEGAVLAGRSGAKKVLSVREKKVQADDCVKLTEHLLLELPKLLSKFSGSSDVVASLMKIPQFFLPESPDAAHTPEFSHLLEEMRGVLELHSDPGVLEAAARTFLSLCEGVAAWSPLARSSRDALVHSWTDQLRTLLGNNNHQVDSFSAEEQTELLLLLRRLRAFHNCHDLTGWSLFELLLPVMLVESRAPPEVLMEVLPCLCFCVFWSLSSSSETLTSRDKAVAQRNQLRLFCESSHRCLSQPDAGVRQQAFLGICDVLTAHSHQLQRWDPGCCGPLRFTLSPKLQAALLSFLSGSVFAGADGDAQSRGGEDGEEERLEELHRRRSLLAAFCKLIVHGVLETSAAAEVFMCYTKFYNDFGDIIKETICRTRQTDKLESARTLLLCLQQLFVRLRREQANGGRSQPRPRPQPRPPVQTFTSIKELARRFALTFGDPVKFRECVVTIHRDGVDFVFQEFVQTPDTPTPPLLSFLTILGEFSSKLLKPDKRSVFSFLHRHTSELLFDLRDDSWQPLLYYRASLLAAAAATATEGEDAASYVSSERRPHPPGRSPPPPPKPKAEGSRSPGPLSPADSRGGKGQRSCFSPSRQDPDPFSVPADPPLRRPTEEDEEDEDDIEVDI